MATKKKKKKTLKQQAAELANSQYAGILGQLSDTRTGIRNQYNRFVADRGTALNNEIGSDKQTGQIVQNAIAGRKANVVASSKAAYDKNELARSLKDKATEAENSNALSNYEALLKSRGLEPSQAAGMAANFKTQQGFSGQLDAINRQSAADSAASAGTAMDTLATQAATSNMNAEANARAAAQKDYSSQYATTMTKDEEVASELAKTKLEKANSQLNTYLVLKKEYQQRKAEAAANALSASMSMSKQASTDYFKEVSANQAQQRIDISAKKVTQDGKIAADKFLASREDKLNRNTIDIAKIEADAKKNGVTLPSNWWTLYKGTPKNKPRKWVSYDPKTGKLKTHTS